MNLKIIPLSLFLLAASCGDNSPFDEDYWQQPEVRDVNDVSANDTRNFTSTLVPISASLGDLSGTVNISITQTDVESTTHLIEVPQSLMIGQRSITNQSCVDIAASFPTPDIINDTSEFKNFYTADNGSREALIAELNQDDPGNGESVNLGGKSYVIKAYVQNLNTPIPESINLVPIACGAILEQARNTNTSGTGGGTTTGGTVGTIGGSIGGTTGIDGAAGGGTTGSDGSTSGTAGGVIGGSIGGGIGGTTGI